MALRIVRLEERIVLDAAGAAVLAATPSADAPAADTGSASDQASDHDANHEADTAADQAADTEATDPVASSDTQVEHQDIDDTLSTDQVIAALSETLDQGGVNVVLLDTSLADYNQIAAAVAADAVVLFYDGQTDSADEVIGQVVAYAQETGTSIDSLSILSHGKTGEFKLGNEWIDAAHLSDHAAAWDALDAVMNDGGNIYLFGCHVAEGPAVDQALLDVLAQATQTDVFASDDTTGQGGDWELEAASAGDEGELNNGLDTNLDTSALAGYSGTLAPPVILSAQAVDNDGDGQIDHIRIVTDQNLDDDFSGFSATVAGYTLDGTTPYLTNIGAGGANDTTFYIKVNESGSPDTNATPLVTITANTTLSNTFGENISTSTSSDTGAQPASAYGSGTADTPTGVYADGGSDSYIAYTQYQIWSGCHLSDAIPDGATINGIEVYVDATSVGATSVSLSWNGGSSFTSTQSYSSLGVNTLGGSSDTWGRTWSKSELSDSNFNIRFAVGGINFAGSWIDYFTVKVYYTASTSFTADDLNDTPTISDGTFAVNENVANGTAVGTVSASDPDVGDTLSYSITAGNDAGVFAINSSTGQITVANNANLDRETYSSFALTVQTSDGAATDTATITVNVNDLNDNTPVANNATVALTENSANGTSVHTVVATDADPSAVLSYSIIGGNGAGVFAINSSTGEITVANNANLNREAYAAFNLTVQVSDGTYTDTAAINVNVNDVNEFTPVANDATVALAENSANGIGVHTVVASDADPTATLTYSIIGGNGAGVFAIDSSTGEITVADNTNLDRETYASFALTVQVSDGANVDTATITVNVGDVNESTPVANNATVALIENAANGTSVHTVVATDADPTATLTYSIIGGNGAGIFAINSSTGEITVADNTNLDREAYASFALTVQVSDGANTDTATINVNVSDVNESTPVANDAIVALIENAANGTSLHTVVATDADPTATLTYSIIGGNGAGVFAINSSTGEITVADNTNLDREAYASFALTVEVSDGTNSDTATISINVNDLNESAPVANDATVALTENTANGTSVHTVVATDADPTAVLSYTIIGGNGAGVFAINGATGEITVADNTNLDRESYASFALTVQVSDGANSDTATITVTVNDVNESTPVANDATVALAENSANGSSVHTVVATDADPSAVLSYAIIGGNDAGVFAINSATGEITVADNTNLDREAYASFALTVQVSDGANTDTATITVNVSDLNESTPVANDATVPLTENSANGTSVHTVVATDADPTATLTYSIIGGNGAGVFAINGATGEITVTDNTNLDREAYASFALTVQVSDGTNNDTATITVNVTDVNESTPVANDATVALAENSANGSSVHTVMATDADPAAVLSYAIISGNGAGVFTIDSGTGEITVTDNTNLDRETYASFALIVQVSDGANTDIATITVNVSDLNESTPVANDATVALAENSANGSSVHTVVATDADPTATLTYSIIGGNGAGVFAIDSTTGEITVADNTNLDREAYASFALMVQVSDGTNSDTATITINVNDVNESTPVANDAIVALIENAANGTSVHTVVATDADPTATLTYSIIGGNGAGIFAINGSTGEITVTDNTNLDRESYASFALTVQVSDGTNTDTATITVNVSDVNESTPVANDAIVPLAENSANGSSVHTVVATDADPTATLTYAIIGGNGAGVFAINSSTGEITVANNTNLDRESYASFALTVQVSDGTNSDTATIAINVSDVNEFTPVASDATVALIENAANGTSVHTVAATDADPSATLTYSIIGGNGAGVFAINSATGEITVADNTNLDRETYASFALTVQVSDGANTDSATITINVTDINDSAPLVDNAIVSLPENSPNGTSVHTITATDADPSAVLTYSITAGNEAGVFAIDAATGQIILADNAHLDREAYASFTLRVQVSDGMNTGMGEVIVQLTDVNEFAPAIQDASISLAENAANGTVVHTVAATDADASATLTYAIIAGNEGGVFHIDPVSGAIVLADNATLDSEATPSYTLLVQVTDGSFNTTTVITITIEDAGSNIPVIDEVEDPVLEEEEEKPQNPAEPVPEEIVPGNDLAPLPGLSSDETIAGQGADQALTPAESAVVEGTNAPVYAFAQRNEYHEVAEYFTTLADRKNLSKHEIQPSDLEGTPALKTRHVEMFSAPESFERESDRMFVGVMAGITALVAGYVGWINNLFSLLLGFFTSAPLWKMLDPVPVLDLGRQEEARQVDDGNEEEDRAEAADILFDNKRRS